MSDLIEVARLAELEEGRHLAVIADGRELVLVKWRDRVFAIRNVCPHQGTKLHTGYAHVNLVGRQAETQVRGAVDFAVDDKAPVIKCPMHKWEFRLTDGICATDPRFRVRTYPTQVRDGSIFVET